MVHVPNKGMNPAVVDLLAGEVQVLPVIPPCRRSTHRVRSALSLRCRPLGSGTQDLLSATGRAFGPAAMDAQTVATLHDAVVSI
jgi:hypothetical protein